jgi:putative oxidoreductase
MSTDPSVQSRNISAETVRRRSIFRRMKRACRLVEVRVSEELRRVSLPILRTTFGVVFVWFGALKVVGATPVADFVAGTLPWFDRAWLIPVIGLFEVAIGLGMVLDRFLVLVCAVLVGHLLGTFLSLVMQSDVTFQRGNPLLLATEGEFVVKNVVFIAAALVLAARFDRRDVVAVPTARAVADIPRS